MANEQLQLAESIMLWRKRRGMNQEQLAEAAGVSRNSISLMERGEYNPTIGWLGKVAGALEIALVVGAVDTGRREREGDRPDLSQPQS